MKDEDQKLPYSCSGCGAFESCAGRVSRLNNFSGLSLLLPTPGLRSGKRLRAYPRVRVSLRGVLVCAWDRTGRRRVNEIVVAYNCLENIDE